MDILPSGNIFRELQDIHDTGYFSSQASIEDQWQQASVFIFYNINSNGGGKNWYFVYTVVTGDVFIRKIVMHKIVTLEVRQIVYKCR